MARITDDLLALQAPYTTVGEFFASAGFSQWYPRFFTNMVRYVQHLFGFELAIAEDIVQQAALHLVESKQDVSLIPGLSVGHLLRVHVRWTAVHRFDQRNHPIQSAHSFEDPELQPRDAEGESFASVLEDPGPLLEDQIVTKERLIEAGLRMQALPQLQRELLTLAAMGFSGREVMLQAQARHPDLNKHQLSYALATARQQVRGQRHAKRKRMGGPVGACRVCQAVEVACPAWGMCAACNKRFLRFQRATRIQGAERLAPSAMLDAFLLALAKKSQAEVFQCQDCGKVGGQQRAKGVCVRCYGRRQRLRQTRKRA